MPLTRAQEAKYWYEWTACKAVRKARGLAIGDDARHALHVAALGSDVSMKALNNRQFDRVLAMFASFSRPGDLNAQMRAEDQPAERAESLINKCYELLDELEVLGKKFTGTDAKERYLNGTSWAVLKKRVDDLDDREAAKLFGCILRQLKREQARQRAQEQQAAPSYAPSVTPAPF